MDSNTGFPTTILALSGIPTALGKMPPKSPRFPFVTPTMQSALACAIVAACSYPAATAAAPETPEASATNESQLLPSGDPDLDDVRRLAVQGPVEELARQGLEFVVALQQDYPGDDIAWTGLRRLTAYICSHPDVPRRVAVAGVAAQMIEHAQPSLRSAYADLIPLLRAIH